MLILIPCKFYYSPYSCPQIFIHNLLTLQSDLFGKFKLFRISEDSDRVTDYRACRQLGPAGNALPPSLLVAFYLPNLAKLILPSQIHII